MKKVMVLGLAVLAVVTMAGVSFAIDEENEIAKRHKEWMGKVRVAEVQKPKVIDVGRQIDAAEREADKANTSVHEGGIIMTYVSADPVLPASLLTGEAAGDVEVFHAPLIEYKDGKVASLTIFGKDGNPVDTYGFDAVDGKLVIVESTHYGAETGGGSIPLIEYEGDKISRIIIPGSDGKPVDVYVFDEIDGKLRIVEARHYDPEDLNGPNYGDPIVEPKKGAVDDPQPEIKKGSVDRDVVIKDDIRYESDVNSGSGITGNVSYGGKEGLDMSDYMIKKPYYSGQKGPLTSFGISSQPQPQLPLTPEQMAALQDRLAADRAAHNGSTGNGGLTLVNGRLSSRDIPTDADSGIIRGQLPIQRYNHPATGNDGVSAGFSMVSEMVGPDNLKGIAAPKARK